MFIKRLAPLVLAGFMPLAAAAQQNVEVKFSFKQSPNSLAPGTRGSDGYHLPHGPGATLLVPA